MNHCVVVLILYGMPADFGFGAGSDGGTQGTAHELSTKTVTDHWAIAQHGLQYQDLGLAIAQQGIIGAHAAAHDSHGCIGFNGTGEFLTGTSVACFVDYAMKVKPCAEIGCTLRGLVLKYQYGPHASALAIEDSHGMAG
jgi:hypothetical protein